MSTRTEQAVNNWDALVELCGYTQDDSFQTVTLHQDDATGKQFITLGTGSNERTYFGDGWTDAIENAVAGEKART